MGLLNDTFSPTFVLLAKLSWFRQIPVDLDEKGNTKSRLNNVIPPLSSGRRTRMARKEGGKKRKELLVAVEGRGGGSKLSVCIGA